MFCCSCIYFFNYNLICVDILFSFLQAKHLPQRVRLNGTTSVSGQLPTYPSPNPKLTLTCYQLTFVELGEGQVGRWAVAQILILIRLNTVCHIKDEVEIALRSWYLMKQSSSLWGDCNIILFFFLTIKNCDKKIS